jgi:hypothetical protein
MKRIALLLALGTSVATPALAGPPWISIEVRPHGGTFVFARTFHHGTPQGMPITGTAEGLVNGQRRTVNLRFDRTSEANVFGVSKNWGSDGVWVLNIGTVEEHGGAGSVVGVDRSGLPAFVRFPRTVEGASRIATSAEVEAMLRALAANQQPPALSSSIGIFTILRIALPLMVLFLASVVLLKTAQRVVAWARRPVPITI